MSKQPTERPALSFCTWLYEWPLIRYTLPINLWLTSAEPVEFAIVDCGSCAMVSKWLDRKNGWRRRVRLKRYPRDEATPIHFSRDKNRAHELGRGRILVNLDGDNIVGPRFVRDVVREVDRGAALVHVWTGEWLDGTCGRIAITRDAFRKLGGYDESFEAVGYQDLDLIERARAAGLKVRTIRRPECVGAAIRSGLDRKMRYVASASFDDCNSANQARSRANIKAGRLVANGKGGK